MVEPDAGLEVFQILKPLRLWVLSDLHTDHAQNLVWLKERALRENSAHFCDVLLCAGDIASSEKVINETLALLAHRFDLVFFCVGNHDAHILARKDKTSVEKIADIQTECRKLGIRLNAAVLKRPDKKALLIAPLESWYEADFDIEPDIPGLCGDSIKKRLRWVDYSCCRWDAQLENLPGFHFGPEFGASSHLAQYFADRNRAQICDISNYFQQHASSTTVISMSHFAPRPDCLPEKRFLIDPHLPKVSGSTKIEAQLRQINSKIHIFGHTHLAVDYVADSVRYLNWPLGSFRERQHQTRIVSGSGILLLYDEARGFADIQPTFWSYYYSQYPRDANICLLAPWVRRVYNALGLSVDESIQAQQAALRAKDPNAIPFPQYPENNSADIYYARTAKQYKSWRAPPYDADDFQSSLQEVNNDSSLDNDDDVTARF
uniref:Calcineurin-like phosphoesterase domain-containing protein n=1 Tax=Aureoumbra lagunensis TaxID=44058 RepID=A0A7S3JZH3_9STRA